MNATSYKWHTVQYCAFHYFAFNCADLCVVLQVKDLTRVLLYMNDLDWFFYIFVHLHNNQEQTWPFDWHHVKNFGSFSSCICCQLTSEPEGEMGIRRAGEEGRPLSMSKGSSLRGLFFFSVSRSLISPEPWLWPSARVRTPDKKSAISSYKTKQKTKRH